MTKSDETAFISKLVALCEVFHLAKPTESLIDAYWSALADLSFMEFSFACERALRESTFLPKPAELRAYSGRGVDQRKREAVVAWEVVRAAMDKYDYTSSVDFGPAVNWVVRAMGGWQLLCRLNLRDLGFAERRFGETYLLFAGKQVDPAKCAPLRGAFGGKPVLFQIPGQPDRRVSLPEVETKAAKSASDFVHALADAKAAR